MDERIDEGFRVKMVHDASSAADLLCMIVKRVNIMWTHDEHSSVGPL